MIMMMIIINDNNNDDGNKKREKITENKTDTFINEMMFVSKVFVSNATTTTTIFESKFIRKIL